MVGAAPFRQTVWRPRSRLARCGAARRNRDAGARPGDAACARAGAYRRGARCRERDGRAGAQASNPAPKRAPPRAAGRACRREAPISVVIDDGVLSTVKSTSRSKASRVDRRGLQNRRRAGRGRRRLPTAGCALCGSADGDYRAACSSDDSSSVSDSARACSTALSNAHSNFSITSRRWLLVCSFRQSVSSRT